MTSQVLAPFGPMADPRKLARTGEVVRQHLLRHPAAEPIVTAGAEMFRVRSFLERRACRAILRAIDDRAVPSTLYSRNAQQGVRTSGTRHFAGTIRSRAAASRPCPISWASRTVTARPCRASATRQGSSTSTASIPCRRGLLAERGPARRSAHLDGNDLAR